MLGEDHSLISDFPEHKAKIKELKATSSKFAKAALQYHELDAEIRKLELDSSPIDDEAMHKLKHDRAVLKDSLYQQLL